MTSNTFWWPIIYQFNFSHYFNNISCNVILFIESSHVFISKFHSYNSLKLHIVGWMEIISRFWCFHFPNYPIIDYFRIPELFSQTKKAFSLRHTVSLYHVFYLIIYIDIMLLSMSQIMIKISILSTFMGGGKKRIQNTRDSTKYRSNPKKETFPIKQRRNVRKSNTILTIFLF